MVRILHDEGHSARTCMLFVRRSLENTSIYSHRIACAEYATYVTVNRWQGLQYKQHTSPMPEPP